MADRRRVLEDMPEWFDTWHAELITKGPGMSDRQLEACANLATVLLCGEQSAIHIFAAEVERRRQQGAESAIRDLVKIEIDEHLHEHALRLFCDYLPTTDIQHQLKRRAQRFFTSLGRIDDMSQHFARISQLDSAVCKIMWHVENSSLDQVAPLSMLAGRIKLDEARHVAVSRRYSEAMNYDKRAAADDAHEISGLLVQMLEPLGDSFENIGVDSDRLFAHLLHHPRS